ncbi:UNVERIFIED_CONTAM: hypothetical protein Slati_3416900 [Sesamum latifolium]|uniref:Reverse transcriptase domain-containing protein n=1 Tax=Sesamum latifolium TaxID=2727402 RepID=A0AAW2UG41_9LAMI
MVDKSNLLQWPQHTRFTPAKKYSNKYCKFHKEKGHDTEDCYQLKDEIERDRFRGKEIEDRRDTGNRENVPVKGVINMMAGGPGGGDSRRMRKINERSVREDRRKELVMNVEVEEEITFSSRDLVEIGSADIIFWNVLRRMGLEDSNLSPVQTPLVGFGGSEVASMGTIDLPVSMGEEPKRRDQKMKFPTKNGIGEVSCDRKEARMCYNLSLRKGETEERVKRKEREIEEEAESKKFKSERMVPAEEYKSIELIVGKPDKTTRIGSNMNKYVETMMIELLRNNMDMFAWSPSDFKGIDPEVIVHRLNVDPMTRSIK